MNQADYIKYPTTIKILIQEIKHICDDYTARKIPEDIIRYYIQYWATNSGNLFFDGGSAFNPTVQQRIGSKRLTLVEKMLAGMQYTI